MRKASRFVLVAVLAASSALGATGVAHAAISDATGRNVQEGDNRSTGNQSGSDKSGDAVGGQVTGVVSSGRTSVDARNTSANSSVSSGDVRGSNSASTFTGLNTSDGSTTIGTADITGSCNGVVGCANLQEGSNRSTYTQSASYTTGDGVAGQVIGAVTAAGGSTSIVAANTSTNNDVQTGDARGTNDLAAFTGLQFTFGTTTVAADIANSCTGTDGCGNTQQGNNRTTARQTSTAHTGDGVAGQVIGAVSAGATSIDATNKSDNNSVNTGDATANNGLAAFTGQALGTGLRGGLTVGPADIVDTCNGTGVPAACGNVQEGANTGTYNQSSSATSGDGVGGEVIGVVTSAGGSASVVAANTSTNSDISTGDATSDNAFAAFVGLNTNIFRDTTVAADIVNSCTNPAGGCTNVQQGNNRLTGSQTATSHTGDGVGGQVLGVVSAGATSLDATNRTDDSSVQTGDARANNSGSQFVGLNDTIAGDTLVGADISGARAANVQDGSNRKTFSQSADATSGDAVAGQVSGVVTSAGGSASVVLANTSTGIDSTSGDGRFDNTDNGFVGLNQNAGTLTVI